MKLVLAEKPSVAQSIAKVLGATKREDILIRNSLSRILKMKHSMVFHSLLFCIGTNRETPSHKIFSANLTHRRKASVWKMLR